MKTFFILLCVALAVVAQPDLIEIKVANLQPEGIEFTSATNFLVSSLTAGTVLKVSDDGTTADFVSDVSLVNSVGLHVDAAENRLYIANVNFLSAVTNAPGFQAGIVIAELDTGNFLSAVDLTQIGTVGRARLANDLVPDKNNNVYVTDSFGAQIWKVDATGVASTFIADSNWEPLANSSGIGLNGIEIDPKDQAFLIVGQSGIPGKIWKVPFVAGNAGTPVEVKTDVAINGIDGITFASNENLFVVNNPEQIVYELRSTDNWETATLVAQASSKFPTPTTLTFANGSPYVVHAYFQDRAQYEIEKVELIPVDGGDATNVVFNLALVMVSIVALFAF